MPDREKDAEQASHELTGGQVDEAEVSVVGSGISETSCYTLRVVSAPTTAQKSPLPWNENREMITNLLLPILEQSYQCPGREKAQCCQAGDGQVCLPQWRMREDPEWYAQEINKLLSQVTRRIFQQGALVLPLAADDAFELGCLFTEALIKFKWDTHAKRGKKIADGAREGGEAKRNANRRRKSSVETVAAVDALLEQGVRKKVAYWQVADDQGVSHETIRKEYLAAKKER